MDLLLDVNIVIDICACRVPYAEASAASLIQCAKSGGKLWIYTGSVPTLEYSLIGELKRSFAEQNQERTNREICWYARSLLKAFSSGKNWLAALAGEGDVFDSVDPEDEQLINALSRFQSGTIKLLTRNGRLLKEYPELTISPEQYCQLPVEECKFNFIDLASQQHTILPRLEHNIHKVLQHGRYILGPEVQDLEKKLADFVGVKHCVGVSSGTDALLMSLMAQGVGPGDAVFTTPFTFIATSEVVSLLGATPVFVDIDPATYNIDPAQLKLAIKAVNNSDSSIYPIPQDESGNPLKLIPKGIITVDLFGLPADYDFIMAIANEHGLFVLEDAAQGLGGVYKGRQAGGLGHMGTTSFFPAKPLGCYGDGGAVFTDDDQLADTVRSIRVHGKGTDKYDNIRIGVNARLHTMQASILISKLEIFPNEIHERQRVAKQYSEGLKNTSLTIPFVPDGLQSVWAQYSLMCDDRESIQEHLKTLGIPTAVYYGKPLHLQPAYQKLHYKWGDMPNAERVSQHIFSLPMHPYLINGEIDRVVQAVRAAL